MLICGLLVPAHLRAVDGSILRQAGRRTPSLVDRGLALVKANNLGAAELMLQAARTEALADRENLRFAVTNLALAHPGWQSWGGGDAHLESLFGASSSTQNSGAEPLTEWAVRLQNREKVLQLLPASQSPSVQALMKCRDLTNTVIFPPSSSSSGQAFDTAIAIGGLLLQERKLAPGMSDAVLRMVSQAGFNPQPLEQVLMDFMSLGQRFNWAQLAEFAGRMEDPETLRVLAQFVRRAGPPPADVAAGPTPPPTAVLFAAVELSAKPSEVARYLMNFSQTGVSDLGAAIRSGAGGVNELVGRDQQLYTSAFRERVAAHFPFSVVFNLALGCSWRAQWLALTLKWALLLGSGFLLAAALHYGRGPVPVLEQPLQVRGLHFAREVLFGLGFLLAVLLLSEPFLPQASQKVEMPFRLRLPTAGSPVQATMPKVKSTFMKDERVLLTLMLFFVLQGLLYSACLLKLAEIRRQRVPARVKLKLLENEDHLFDAGLYLGFVGTIISLILFSLGVMAPSLMAAYSSTSFGIIFVSIFKIFHLRPTRRKLLLEAESSSPEPVVRAMAPAYATPS
jgi:hypothetical protein